MTLGARMVLTCAVLATIVLATGNDARAQPPVAGTFNIEWKKRTDPHLRPGLEGWVANPSNYRVGSMLLKVQTLEADRVAAERTVWVYGHVPPQGRAFFVVPIIPEDRYTYRITVDSFDLIAREGD